MGNAVGGIADNLPGWLLEFHAIGLRELCRKCLTRLPAYLGFTDVSMYLHDPEKGILTLAGTTHTRPIDLAVRVGGDNTHLMVAVARGGKIMATDRVATERRHRGVQRPDGEPRYPDGSCLIAPLVAGGQLWGVLNFTSRQRKLSPNERLALPAVFDFIAKSLRYARAHHRARTQARVDPLTGLYNRRWVLETLTKEVRRSQRFATPLSLVVADLDGLKAINDANGHMAGDCLLRHVAGRITARLRQFDSAARIGGDESVMLLPATDADAAESSSPSAATRPCSAACRCPSGRAWAWPSGSPAGTLPTYWRPPTRPCTRPSSKAVTKWSAARHHLKSGCPRRARPS
jgi:GGDEF domain-containing protein